MVLAGHSLGGLLIKQMVKHCATMGDQYEHVMDQLTGVIFFSTPHNGSGLASVARFVRLARITPLTAELSGNQADLRDLDNWYRNRATKTGLKHLSFFETKNTYFFRVVGEDSGDPQLPGMSAIPVDAGHRTICKFSNRDVITYRQVRRFVETCTALSLPNGTMPQEVTYTGGPGPESRRQDEAGEAGGQSDQSLPSVSAQWVRSNSIGQAGGRPSPGAIRVSDVVPQRLGVHPAIVVRGMSNNALPAYVDRDVDLSDGGLRDWMGKAAQRGGFLLVVGGSSVGKTRSAYEAVRAVYYSRCFTLGVRVRLLREGRGCG